MRIELDPTENERLPKMLHIRACSNPNFLVSDNLAAVILDRFDYLKHLH